jgi:hypothetical protein
VPGTLFFHWSKTLTVRQNVKEKSERQKISDPLTFLPFAAGDLNLPAGHLSNCQSSIVNY